MSNLLTTKQLSERWGITEHGLRKRRMQGSGPQYVKLGEGRNAPIRYRVEDIEKYEKENLYK